MPKIKRIRIERKVKKALVIRLLHENENFKRDYENLQRLSETEYTPEDVDKALPPIIGNLFDQEKYAIIAFNFLSQFKLEFQPDIRIHIMKFNKMSNNEISITIHQIMEFILKERLTKKLYYFFSLKINGTKHS